MGMFSKKEREEARANKAFVKDQISGRRRKSFAESQAGKKKRAKRQAEKEQRTGLVADHLHKLHSGGDSDDVLQLGADLLYLPSLSDIQFKIEDQLDDSGKIASRWTVYGKHAGDFMGIPPTGREIKFSGMSVTLISIEPLRLTQEFHYWDVTAVLQQMQSG